MQSPFPTEYNIGLLGHAIVFQKPLIYIIQI